MKLLIEKDKCKIGESINGRFLEIETKEPIELTGGNGNDYFLLDECDEGVAPSPACPFVVRDGRERLTKMWETL